MVGKKKKEQKQKKGKSGGDGASIGAAVMPSISMAAAPRSPPPPATLPDLDPNLTSNILTSSLLGRMFQTAEPDGNYASETDTSLYDYENAKEAYAALNFRAGPSGESVHHIPSVQPPSPYRDGRYSESDDDFISDSEQGSPGGTRSSSHFAIVHEEPSSRTDPPYSRVKKNKHDSNDSDLTYVTDDLGGPSTRGKRSRSNSPRLKGRTPSPKVYHRPERDSPDIESRATEPTEPTEPTDLTEDSEDELLHTSSPKLAMLAEQNAKLLAQVESQQLMLQKQQQQLTEQHQLQLQVLDRLAQSNQAPEETLKEMGSILNSTQSVTEGTLRQQDEIANSLKERGNILEEEKRELMELNEQLQAEINSLHRMASFKDADEGEAGSQIMLLKKQLQDFRDERDTLKAAVHRLNVELSKYQAKYRKPSDNDTNIGFPMKRPIPSWLVNAKYLAPLFVAYDDKMNEKDDIIRRCEDELDGFREHISNVIKENDRLHLRLEQTDIGGPDTMTEWRQLQEQCKLVLEENQLLMEQLDLQQNKAHDMHRAHVQEVSKLSKKLVTVEADRTELESQMHQMKIKYDEMKKKYDTSIFTSHNKLNVEEHVTVVQDLKRSQEDEKVKMEHEIDNAFIKLQSLQAEKKALSLQVEDLKMANKHLEAELKLMHKAQRKSQRKISLLERTLAEVESREHTASTYLSNVVRTAEKTAMERDSFALAAHNEERQKKKVLNKLVEGAVEKDRMEEKLKLYKMKLTDKLQKASNRIKAQDKDFSNERAEYEREIRHVRMLLNEREELLEMVNGEKNTVEDDLETMWQVATSDNKRMRETMRSSIRKLRQHAGLGNIISNDLDDELTNELLEEEKT